MKALIFTLALVFSSPAFAELVNVGSHQVDAQHIGRGPYTVVFESGFGSGLEAWQYIAPTISNVARVVTYSRAGLGNSPGRGRPMTLEESVEELDQVLKKYDVQDKIVLVGHSFGSFVIRAYAAKYPTKVAGFVFIDPVDEDMEGELRKVNPRGVDKDFKLFGKYLPDSQRDDFKMLLKILRGGKLDLPLPDVPTVVLTALKSSGDSGLFLESPQAVKVKRQCHEKFFAQFTTGAHMVTNRSSHSIQEEEPEIVNGAVIYVLQEAVRRKRDNDKIIEQNFTN